ncbi:MAG: radical SAM/SPASM domain-containing protein [Gemmatimonadota bacterium]|nr:radical SAM/SPASM domain-containing protein [Gemmatimonadota bacterium]
MRSVPRAFDAAPAEIVWETTRAGGPAPLDPVADPRPREPGELSTIEAMLMMNRLRAFGRPRLVLSGGDPTLRADLVGIVDHARRLDLPTALVTADSDRLDGERLARLHETGLGAVIVAMADPDGGSLGPAGRRLLREIGAAASASGIALEAVTAAPEPAELQALRAILLEVGARRWWARFPIPCTGGKTPDPGTVEETLVAMAGLSRDAPFGVATRAAPHYRRVLLQRRRGDRERSGTAELSIHELHGASPPINDGDGTLFVGHAGEIRPSASLPMTAGNVRTHDVVETYRSDPVFLALRDRDRLKGKCGRCEYRTVCGGSRARARALTGDVLAPDPACPHRPTGEADGADGPVQDRLAACSGWKG